MMLFAIMGAMVALAALVILLPAFCSTKESPSQSASELSLYQDQLNALAADGSLSSLQKTAAKAEIERRILNIAPPQSEWGKASGKGPIFLLILFLVSLAPASFVLYSFVGSPHLASPVAGRNAGHDSNMADMRRMVDGLAARLEKDPDNIDGWVLLSRSFLRMNERDRALLAARRAVTLQPDNIEARRVLAFSLMAKILSGDMPMIPDALDLLKQLSDQDPEDADAHYFLGRACLETGDVEGAKAAWRRLRDLFLPGSENYKAWDKEIGALEGN